MMSAGHRIGRALLPAGAFAAVLAVHIAWHAVLPDQDPAQSRWVTVPAAGTSSWLVSYWSAGDHWLGLSYAMSLAFAAYALRRFLELRSRSARNAAVGGVTFGGFLAVAGCFLVGCCGSPMLAVWLNLFGAAFLPFAKPLVAAVTAVFLLATWIWMRRRSPRTPENATGPRGREPRRTADLPSSSAAAGPSA